MLMGHPVFIRFIHKKYTFILKFLNYLCTTYFYFRDFKLVLFSVAFNKYRFSLLFKLSAVYVNPLIFEQ